MEEQTSAKTCILTPDCSGIWKSLEVFDTTDGRKKTKLCAPSLCIHVSYYSHYRFVVCSCSGVLNPNMDPSFSLIPARFPPCRSLGLECNLRGAVRADARRLSPLLNWRSAEQPPRLVGAKPQPIDSSRQQLFGSTYASVETSKLQTDRFGFEREKNLAFSRWENKKKKTAKSRFFLEGAHSNICSISILLTLHNSMPPLLWAKTNH